MIEEPLIIKKKKKKLEIKSILVSLLVIVIGIFGISYAFFNYYGLSNKKQEIIALSFVFLQKIYIYFWIIVLNYENVAIKL